ncbi:hypothetical protein [Aquisphaera insulae]|uniref:hypothetical protein n=1 Tax=Aquisphaera insulae TaxID=2712864 RepID=UPI0013EC0264|nr:hypothetical protein [Aquisphaera insulae]
MSSLYRPILAPLPLLLWKTPPGLELILAQEGIAHEVIRDAHPYAFRRGRFVLYDGRTASRPEIRSLTTREQVAIDVDLFRRGEPVDPFEALVDQGAAGAIWKYRQWRLRERVARYPKAWIRRALIDAIRGQVESGGGTWMRLAPFPYPYRSAFNLRVDLDEPVPEDYHRFALTRNLLADCTTHFVSTQAYEHHPVVMEDLLRQDTQSHGHFHYVYRDATANARNLERADAILRDRGFAPGAFAGPHGRWNPGLDDVLESLGYEYSSDFQLGYDDLPFFPWKGTRFSDVLQVPIHPVCEGLFLEDGDADGRIVAEYLCRVVEAKIAAGEPAFVYGHPERRLGRMPEVLIGLNRVLDGHSLVWRTTLTEMARWWRWRASRRFVVLPRGGGRLEIQVEDWDEAYPLAMEIHRGDFSCTIPLRGTRTVIRAEDLVYERRPSAAGGLLRPPCPDRRPPGLREAVRRAIDWETVTPLQELSTGTLSDRVKKGLRWWKLRRTGTD